MATRRTLFLAVWLMAAIVTGSLVVADRHLSGESQLYGAISLLVLLVANGALILWLPATPVASLPASPTTRRGAFAAVIVGTMVVLFSAVLLGPALLLPVAVAAGVVLLALRQRIGRREVAYASLLGVLAAAAGSLDWLVSRNAGDLTFALLQAPLAAVCLVAGWAIAREVGWTGVGIGKSQFLAKGGRAALTSFALGMALAVPWALGNIAGGLFGDSVKTVWQPMAALQPGIAEEAWGRVFLIALLYLLYRRIAKARPALIAAGAVGALWFAWLHVPMNPIAATLMALAYAAPLVVLWLKRDVETAIGFHFFSDFVRFFATFLAFRGLWYS